MPEFSPRAGAAPARRAFTTGLGFSYGNWLSLALLVLLPAAVTMRRIHVEEAVLTSVLGQPYADYRLRTKRLVPGLW